MSSNFLWRVTWTISASYPPISRPIPAYQWSVQKGALLLTGCNVDESRGRHRVQRKGNYKGYKTLAIFHHIFEILLICSLPSKYKSKYFLDRGVVSLTCVLGWLSCSYRHRPQAMCWVLSRPQIQWSMSQGPSSAHARTALHTHTIIISVAQLLHALLFAYKGAELTRWRHCHRIAPRSFLWPAYYSLEAASPLPWSAYRYLTKNLRCCLFLTASSTLLCKNVSLEYFFCRYTSTTWLTRDVTWRNNYKQEVFIKIALLPSHYSDHYKDKLCFMWSLNLFFLVSIIVFLPGFSPSNLWRSETSRVGFWYIGTNHHHRIGTRAKFTWTTSSSSLPISSSTSFDNSTHLLLHTPGDGGTKTNS